ESEQGGVGGGEIRGGDRRVWKPLGESLFELIDGENPTRIEHLWQKLYRAYRDIRGGPFMIHTIAGIDVALWDLAGKLWNTPVYRLLGGPTGDRIRVYHTARAKKIPPGGPDQHSGTPADIERIVASIKPYDLLFIEEPAVPGNIEVFKRLKEKISIPLATGERDWTIFEFLPGRYRHQNRRAGGGQGDRRIGAAR